MNFKRKISVEDIQFWDEEEREKEQKKEGRGGEEEAEYRRRIYIIGRRERI